MTYQERAQPGPPRIHPLGGPGFFGTIISATGGAGFQPGAPATTPDCLAPFGFNMVADYTNTAVAGNPSLGISGALNVNASGLVGVFIGSGAPTGPAPAQRNDGVAFNAISPALNQIFWIRDGLTGTGVGTVQQFTAPTGAMFLYFGTVDGFGWNNNVGTIDVSISQISTSETPLPAALPLFATGLGALRLLGWRRKGKRGPNLVFC